MQKLDFFVVILRMRTSYEAHQIQLGSSPQSPGELTKFNWEAHQIQPLRFPVVLAYIYILRAFPLICKASVVQTVVVTATLAKALYDNLQNPKRKDSGPRLDAEATVGDSFPSYYGTVYAEIDAEIEI